MQDKTVLIIATEGLTTTHLYNKIAPHFKVKKVLIEPHESKVSILKRRFKKLGFKQTLGQILFLLFVLPLLKNNKRRVQSLIATYGLSSKPIPAKIMMRISSVHDAVLKDYLKDNTVDYIFINGTRIIQADTIEAAHCPFINIHVGITPRYRGVHGGFWAVKEKQMQLFGTTLHFVDKGIDTGGIIDQVILTPTKADNFKTYPILQYCGGLKLIDEHLHAFKTGTVISKAPVVQASKLYYHPTIWEFLF